MSCLFLLNFITYSTLNTLKVNFMLELIRYYYSINEILGGNHEKCKSCYI
ncbi:hypothetical protein CNEO4_100149 [Clostridium neonatale]|nr:hypothetical protein CNEO4_100149 [Clostridium neonatale]